MNKLYFFYIEHIKDNDMNKSIVVIGLSTVLFCSSRKRTNILVWLFYYLRYDTDSRLSILSERHDLVLKQQLHVLLFLRTHLERKINWNFYASKSISKLG